MSPASNPIHTEALIAANRALAAQFAADPHRPRYHFLPPAAWMNDINGCICWKGRYHIFYQHNPDEAYWRQMHWGHASSVDLVHWVHHPIALFPTPGGPARDGCFSGGAFLLDGKPALFYHGVPDGTCIATSDDDLLENWTSYSANPIIPVPKEGDPDYDRYYVYDPCAWQEGDGFAALIASRVPGLEGDSTGLFRSDDGIHWRFVGPFYTSDRRWTDAREDCAVPDFFPLGDRHMLLFCSHLVGSQYYIGRYHGDRFHPEVHGRTSGFGGQLGGGRTLRDDTGRRIYFDWIWDLRGSREAASGWSGVMTLPRILSLRNDGTLGITPAPELDRLHIDGRSCHDLLLQPGVELDLPEMASDSQEIRLIVEPGNYTAFGVKVCCSPGREEETLILFDAVENQLKIDATHSTMNLDINYQHYRFAPDGVDNYPQPVQALPLALAPGEPLELTVFLDRSVLEVFANGRQCITQRIYPTLSESQGLHIFCVGGVAHVRRIDNWRIGPAH